MKKILVVSDLHLSNKFSQKKFNILKKIFSSKQYYQIIILGDFFEGYMVTFDKFIKSAWSALFSYLKQKNTIYLPGNHDSEALRKKEKAKIFAEKITKEYQIKIKNKTLFFTHGDLYLNTIDNYLISVPFIIKKFLFKIYNYDNKHSKRSLFYSRKKDYFLTESNKRLIKNFYNKKKNIVQNKNFWLITGHCHNPIIDKKNNYVDTGFFGEEFFSYLEIDEEGNFKLFRKSEK